jgi:hypothetical protein
MRSQVEGGYRIGFFFRARIPFLGQLFCVHVCAFGSIASGSGSRFCAPSTADVAWRGTSHCASDERSNTGC